MDKYWYIFINRSPYFIWISLCFDLMSFFFPRVPSRIPHVFVMSPLALMAGTVAQTLFIFIILTVMRDAGQVFSRMPLYWNLSDAFLIIILGL